MANIPLMKITNCTENLSEDNSELVFIFDVEVQQILTREVFHHKVGNMFGKVKVECMVANDGRMPQHFDAQEVFLQLKVVLLVHFDFLDCIDLTAIYVLALVDGCVSPFSYLLEQPVFFFKTVHHVFLFFLILI